MRYILLNILPIFTSAVSQWCTCLWSILGSISSLRGNFKVQGVVKSGTVTGVGAVFVLSSARTGLLFWCSAATLVL